MSNKKKILVIQKVHDKGMDLINNHPDFDVEVTDDVSIENLKTKFGLIECMKLNPYMEAGRVFKSNKGLELWVTNDDNRVPVKVKANLRVGTIVADLTTFRGLTNPFKIVIND